MKKLLSLINSTLSAVFTDTPSLTAAIIVSAVLYIITGFNAQRETPVFMFFNITAWYITMISLVTMTIKLLKKQALL